MNFHFSTMVGMTANVTQVSEVFIGGLLTTKYK